MRVTHANPPAAVHRRRKVGDAGDAAFSRRSAEAPTAYADVAPAAPLAAPSSVLAVQEAGDGDVEGRETLARGERVLDELQALHLALLDGCPSEQNLARLSALLDRARLPGAPDALARVVDEIELRAMVERAKLERARMQDRADQDTGSR